MVCLAHCLTMAPSITKMEQVTNGHLAVAQDASYKLDEFYHIEFHEKDEEMAVERTLSMIKPDATARNITGKIITKLEEAGLSIIAQKRVRWSEDQAKKFYEVHKERPFYGELVAFMTSGPIVVQVLEGEDAVARNREIMGATNPQEAAPGTIRKEFAEGLERNSVHGSDSVENAAIEIALNFSEDEIVG